MRETMKKSERNYILLIIFLIFGIVLAVQFKSTLYVKRQTASDTLDANALMKQLAAVQKETEDLKASISDNLILRDNIIKNYIDQNNDYRLTDEWDKLKSTAGLTDVKGPGITIKLNDAPARQLNTPVKWIIIHDNDIKIILNDLKKSGAQAIAINGERVEPMSEQVCAGPTILINGNKYSVPYVIDAIGDPDILYDSLSKNERLAEMMQFKIRVEIAKSNEIKISKFSSADNLGRFISGLEEINK
jgi:uncharacterized protein YlxW (UPF0749 family)